MGMRVDVADSEAGPSRLSTNYEEYEGYEVRSMPIGVVALLTIRPDALPQLLRPLRVRAIWIGR